MNKDKEQSEIAAAAAEFADLACDLTDRLDQDNVLLALLLVCGHVVKARGVHLSQVEHLIKATMENGPTAH